MTDGEKRENGVELEPAHFNLSARGFRLWAKQYYDCRHSFTCSDFSPVPYFLLCLAIELQFKAVHLEQSTPAPPGHRTQDDIKNLYWHDLVSSYRDLPAAYRTLSPNQYDVLKKANEVYSKKGFEYVNVHDAVRAFSDFPKLEDLDELATAIMTAPPFVLPAPAQPS